MRRSTVFGVLVGLVVLAAGSASAQQDAEAQRIRYRQVAKVKPNGDAEIATEIVYSVQLYTEKRKEITNTAMLLREMGLTEDYAAYKDLKADFDDVRHAVRVTGLRLGAMRNRGKEWLAEIRAAETSEVIDTDPDALTLLTVAQTDAGGLFVGTVRVEFPAGTQNIRFDPARGGIACELPVPSSQPQGNVDVDMEVQVRPEIMSCFYRIYGNRRFRTLSVGRAMFHNRGTATLQDFRLRYRIPGYAEWSPWEHSKFVYPTQTVVEPFYPIFQPIVRELKSATPATLEVAWSYRTPDGRVVEDSETRRLEILGLNDVIYSSLPSEEYTSWHEAFNYGPLLGATFVSHTDTIVQRFAGMAAGMAGGVAASASKEGALTFMRAVYDLMCHNQIKYQSPPGLFKHGIRQHVKFSRDVLQNRAGTCIDLAILYASTCQSGGLDPGLVMLPGHCFPIIKLPDGTWQPVEITNCSGTPAGQKIPFEAAKQTGEKEWREIQEKGTFYLVDVKKLRAQGVPTPDLPDLPITALTDWGISAPGGVSLPPKLPVEPPKPAGPPAPAGSKRITDPAGASSFLVPESWLTQPQGTGITAGDPGGKACIGCVVQPKAAPDLQSFVQLMVGMWQKSVAEWKETARENVQVSGRPAVHVRATGRPGGLDLVADYYFVLTEQHQLALLTQCGASDVAQWAETFKRAVESWQIGASAAPEGPRPPQPPGGLKRVAEPGGLFAFTVPDAWPASAEPLRATAADPQNKAVVSVAAGPKLDATLALLAARSIPLWRQQLAEWTELAREDLPIAGRPGLHLRATGKHQGQAMAVDYYAVLTDRHQLALVTACPASELAQWADVLRRIAASWEIGGAAPPPPGGRP